MPTPLLKATFKLASPGDRFRPAGVPKVDYSVAPRGMLSLQWPGEYGFHELAHDDYIAKSVGTMGPTPFGDAFDPGNGSGNRYMFTRGAQPTQCSVETMIFFKSAPDSTNRHIAGMAEISPTSGTADRILFVNSSNHLVFYIFDGAAKTADSGVAPVAGQLVHLVGVADGTNLKIYVNGVLKATTAVSNGGFTGYTSPLFTTGYGYDPTSSAVSQFIFPILYAIFSNKAWSAQEVVNRWLNPYGFLVAPEWDMPAVFVGGAWGWSYDDNNAAINQPATNVPY